MLDRPHWTSRRDEPPHPGEETPLISMADVHNLLLGYGRMIVGLVVAALAAALVYLAGATPTYQARAQLLIESKVPHSFIEQISEAFVALDTPQVESQLALLRSEQIAELVVRKHDLVDDPELHGRVPSWSLFGSWSTPDPKAAPAPAAAPGGQQDAASEADKLLSAIAGLQSRMDVRRHGLSYAIDIVYSSADPAKAARIANAIADGYVEDRLRTRAHAARQGSEWLEERISDIRRQMNAAALDVQEFRARRDYRIVGRSDRAGPGDGDAGKGGEARASAAAGAAGAKDTQTLEELEARAHTYRKIYESYLQGYAESVQRQSYPVTNDRVITRATKPGRKSRPRGLLILIGSGLLAAIGGIGIALIHYSISGQRREMRHAPDEAGDGQLVAAE